MVTRFRSINPIQLAIVSAVMYALIGFIAALIMMPFFALMSSLGSHYGRSDFPSGMGIFGGVASIIIFPIFYGVAGFVGGIISALIYNMVAG